MTIHPIIDLFESKAQVLDQTGSKTSVDDAVTLLASWIGVAQDRLSENDLIILSDVGAMLYREGLNRRL